MSLIPDQVLGRIPGGPCLGNGHAVLVFLKLLVRLGVGALGVGAVAIGCLVIGRAKIKRLEIGELIVGRLKVTDSIQTP